MRIKDIQRTANVAWSPSACLPIYIAAGTAAQQLDASFSTSASLELFEVNLAESGHDLQPVTSVTCEHRLNKLVWTGHGIDDGSRKKGLLVLGADNGHIQVYDPATLCGESKPMCVLDKHSGSVAALDANPFQPNLLASGSSDSEIYIWDLTKPDNPMTPGAKSQPADVVSAISWNRQVAHILANTFANRCIVWDLRKSEPIIKISDAMTRMKVKQVCWHPSVATQLCLASEDDHTPVAQLWDLRYATSPIRSLERHTRGILSMAWCAEDSDLLITSGKDNKLFCWDPNSVTTQGEVVAEMSCSDQWIFDVQFCSRNPSLISTCSYDGHVAVHSLLGGTTTHAPTAADNSKLAESFDSFGALPSVPTPTGDTSSQQQPSIQLKKPPSWLKRRATVSFAFGGRLVSVNNSHVVPGSDQPRRVVNIQQVSTEPELVQSAESLESALQQQHFTQFCAMKAANASDENDRKTWNFIQAKFESTDTRTTFLKLLGFEKDGLKELVGRYTSNEKLVDDAAEQIDHLSTQEKPDESDMFGGGASDFDNLTAAGQTDTPDQSAERPPSTLTIPTSDDVEGLLARSLLTGDFSSAVDLCLAEDRLADALVLSIAGGHELLARTQQKYFTSNTSPFARLLKAVLHRSWGEVIDHCDLENWKEALGLCLTYADSNEFNSLIDRLGERLELSARDELRQSAVVCYLCSGNLTRLAQCWTSDGSLANPKQLQELVEKLMLARCSIQHTLGAAPAVEGAVASALAQYASLLATHGSLTSALGYLATTVNPNEQSELLVLYERVYRSLGYAANTPGAPVFPFSRVDVRGTAARPVNRTQPQKPAVGGGYSGTAGYNGTYYPGYSNSSTASYVQPTYTSPPGNISQPVHPTATVAPSPMYSSNSTSSYPAPSVPSPQFPGQTPYQPPHPIPAHNNMNRALPPQASHNSYAPPSHTQQPAAPVPNQTVTDHHIPAPGGGGRKRYPSVGSDPYHEFTNPAHAGASGNPYEPGVNTASPAIPSLDTRGVESYQDKAPPQTGWNDPPAVKPRKSETFEPMKPITAPIYGTDAPVAAPGLPAAPHGTSQLPTATGSQHTSAVQPAAQPAAAVEAVEKPALSAEFVPLQQLLDSVLSRCQSNATNQLTKRKLDEVHRKLQALYDRLRDNALSSAVCQGLLQMLEYLRHSDYASALHIHAQMVSQGNFSEISAFMPGLKVLLQTASQMQIPAQ